MRVSALGREFVFEVKEKNPKNNDIKYTSKNKFMFRFIILTITFRIFWMTVLKKR